MAIPGQTLTINDPGLGVVAPAVTSALYMGVCSSGTVNTLYTFTRIGDAITTLGQGPLAEAVCQHLLIAGGPVYCMRLTGSVAGAAGAVTKTAVSGGTGTGTITVAGAAYDAYSFIANIIAGGDKGTATFQHSLDGGLTYSPTITTPSGGTYAVPNTNLTLTFVSGAGTPYFEAGDSHAFTCTAPYYSTTNLNSAFTALLALSPQTPFAYAALIGGSATGSSNATMAAALSTQLASLFTGFQFVRSIMDGGFDSDTNTKTAFVSFADPRVAVCYGNATVASAKPNVGWGFTIKSIVGVVATRAGVSLLSTDLARVKTGNLPGVTAISYDESIKQTMDSAKFTTLRTWVGRSGFYILNCNLMSSAGSDYVLWQHGRIMDQACTTVAAVQQLFSSMSVRVNADKTIYEADAKSMESQVKDALRALLLDPNSAEGTPGHVSALDYKIDRTTDVLTTNTIKSTVAIRPRGYVKQLTTTLGFSANVGS